MGGGHLQKEYAQENMRVLLKHLNYVLNMDEQLYVLAEQLYVLKDRRYTQMKVRY